MSSLKNLLVSKNTFKKGMKKSMLYGERLLFGDMWVEVNGSIASAGITKNLEMELGDIVIFEFFKHQSIFKKEKSLQELSQFTRRTP